MQVTPKEEIAEGDGLKALDFAEKVEISEAYIDADQLTSLDEAIDEVTKEKEKNQTYEVQSGDYAFGDRPTAVAIMWMKCWR